MARRDFTRGAAPPQLLRLCVDTAPELDRDMSMLLLETDDLESDLDEQVGLRARYSN